MILVFQFDKYLLQKIIYLLFYFGPVQLLLVLLKFRVRLRFKNLDSKKRKFEIILQYQTILKWPSLGITTVSSCSITSRCYGKLLKWPTKLMKH